MLMLMLMLLIDRTRDPIRPDASERPIHLRDNGD